MPSLSSNNNNRSSLREFLASIATIKGDLSNITAPPFVLAAQSTTELPAYWVERPSLFTAPAREEDPQKRALLVLKWFLAALKQQQYAGRDESEGVKKPLNAFLGEVFIAQWSGDTGTTKLISEQVSHHPPVTACYLCNDEQGIRAEGYTCQNITFSGSVNIKQTGHAILHIDRYNENHIIPLPDVRVSGLLSGTPYPELIGKYQIISSSGFVSEVTFSGKTKLGFSGSKNQFHAETYKHEDAARAGPLYTVEGAWNGSFVFKDSEGREIETFNTNAMSAEPLQVAPIEEQDLWESRRAWTGVHEALNRGDMQGTSDEKAKIEQGQREMRKREEAEGKKWKPKFFIDVKNDEGRQRSAVILDGTLQAEEDVGVWKFNPSVKFEKPLHGDLTPTG